MNRLLFSMLTFLLLGCNEPPKYDVVIEKVNLFYGNEDPGKVNVAVKSDTIAAITIIEIQNKLFFQIFRY